MVFPDQTHLLSVIIFKDFIFVLILHTRFSENQLLVYKDISDKGLGQRKSFERKIVIHMLTSGKTFQTYQMYGIKEKAGCFAIIVLQMYCYYICSVALPHSAAGWSAVCDCCIS